MNDLRPQLSTPTFWLAALKMTGSLAVTFGVMSVANVSTVEGALALMVTAGFAFVTNMMVAKHAIVADYQLKSSDRRRHSRRRRRRRHASRVHRPTPLQIPASVIGHAAAYRGGVPLDGGPM
jgi:hypothetical protein